MTRIAAFEPRQWYAQIEALGRLHKEEVEAELPYELSLNREIYNTLYDAGLLVCIGAFADELVGYAGAVIAPNMHYNALSAAHDAVFLHKDYRQPRLALRMVEALEEECKARGVKLFCWHAPIGGSFARLLEKRAKPYYTQYFKEL